MAANEKTHYWVFQLLFMQGYLFHAAEFWSYPSLAIASMAFIVSFLSLQRGSQWLFLGFLVFIIVAKWVPFPQLANHSNLTLFTALFLLPYQLRYCLSGNLSHALVMSTLRCLLLVVYFFVSFHKLNRDFLNPEVSCSIHTIREYFTWFAFLGEENIERIKQGMPYFGLLFESILVPLLWWSRTRAFGVVAAASLHFLLAPLGFSDFSSLAMAFIWSFVALERSSHREVRQDFLWLAIFFVAVQVVFAFWRWPLQNESFSVLEGILLAVGFSPLLYKYFYHQVDRQHLRWPKSVWASGVIVFLIFFASNNYLGLRTAGTFSMFSNLVTEGERSNHLLLGSNPLKIFSFQEDVVEIVQTNHVVHEMHGDLFVKGQRWPRIRFLQEMEILQLISPRSLDLRVKYRGKEYRYGWGEFHHEDLEAPWWQRKYFHFRPLPDKGPQTCRW